MGGIYHQLIKLEDSEGYRYACYVKTLREGRQPNKFNHTNPYSIFNINRWLNKHGRGDYVCIAHEYHRNNIPMEFIHLPCGTHFTATLVEMKDKMKSNNQDHCLKQCPICFHTRLESLHASILKQVFLHKFPKSTIIEDCSCINPETGHILPTDIVVHELKIAIEIQSGYHDMPSHYRRDLIKKEFWESKGYTVYAPDIRNYSIIGMMQLFFPDLITIPSYVDMHDGEGLDVRSIQKLLNQEYSIKQVAHQFHITPVRLRGMIHRGVIKLPQDYNYKVLNVKRIVQLTPQGELVAEYPSVNSVNDCGYASGTIRRVLDGTQKYSYGYIWMYKEDYLNKHKNA